MPRRITRKLTARKRNATAYMTTYWMPDAFFLGACDQPSLDYELPLRGTGNEAARGYRKVICQAAVVAERGDSPFALFGAALAGSGVKAQNPSPFGVLSRAHLLSLSGCA